MRDRALLEFMGYLCWKEAYAADHRLVEALDITVSAQQRFLAEHLGRWAPRFLDRFEAVTTQPLYRAVAAFGQVFLATEATRLGVSPEVVQGPPSDAFAPGAFSCGATDGACPWPRADMKEVTRCERHGCCGR